MGAGQPCQQADKVTRLRLRSAQSKPARASLQSSKIVRMGTDRLPEGGRSVPYHPQAKAPAVARGNHSGEMTLSITWMTPFEAMMSGCLIAA